MNTEVTRDLVAEARAYLKQRGMDAELVDRIPRDTLVFHIGNGMTLDSLFHLCEGSRRAVQTGHQESK